MDILRNLVGNLASGIIRLLVVVGILAAAYLFVVKPALDTTKEISKETNQSFERSFGGDSGQGSIARQMEVRRSFRTARQTGGGDSRRLLRCIQRANQDVDKIQRCTARF